MKLLYATVSLACSVSGVCNQPAVPVEHNGEKYYGKGQPSLQAGVRSSSVYGSAATMDSVPVTTVSSAPLAPMTVSENTTTMRFSDAPAGDDVSPITVASLESPTAIRVEDVAPPVPVQTAAQPMSAPKYATVPTELPAAAYPAVLPEEDALAPLPELAKASQDVSADDAAATHTLKSGETLYRVSRQYGVSVAALKLANDISDVTSLNAGRQLTIPGGSAPAAAPVVTAAKEAPVPVLAAVKVATPAAAPVQKVSVASAPTVTPTVKPAVQVIPPVAHNSQFIWPVRGQVLSQFGRKDGGLYNDGINIRTAEGTPIRAAADGSVVYSDDELGGYGNLIILRHEDGYLSAYAHTLDMMVTKGDRVRQGDVIAHVGTSGDVSSPQLHFGIRQGKTPVNPLSVLDENGDVPLLSAQAME